MGHVPEGTSDVEGSAVRVEGAEEGRVEVDGFAPKVDEEQGDPASFAAGLVEGRVEGREVGVGAVEGLPAPAGGWAGRGLAGEGVTEELVDLPGGPVG